MIKKTIGLLLIICLLAATRFSAASDEPIAGIGTDPGKVREQIKEQEEKERLEKTRPAPFSIKIRFEDEYEVLTEKETKDWRLIKGDGTYVWNDEPVNAYFSDLKEKYDTKPGEVAFTTHDGIKMLIASNACGWHLNVDFSRQRLKEAVETGKEEMDPAWNSGLIYTTENGVGLNYVEVDISTQKVYVYKDHEVIFETDCVTGTANYTETKKGVFQVQGKASPATLRDVDQNGNKYEQPVEYWIAFNGSQGLHDATWRGEFGGEIYKTWGSHGCVNLPLDAAKRIYEEVYIYCPVIVH